MLRDDIDVLILSVSFIGSAFELPQDLYPTGNLDLQSSKVKLRLEGDVVNVTSRLYAISLKFPHDIEAERWFNTMVEVRDAKKRRSTVDTNDVRRAHINMLLPKFTLLCICRRGRHNHRPENHRTIRKNDRSITIPIDLNLQSTHCV